MREGHVEYAPIKNNPMRSGYKFVYQEAKLNLTLYFPEKIFNRMLEILNPEKIQILKAVVESSIPKRSGYLINEFKIRGIMEEEVKFFLKMKVYHELSSNKIIGIKEIRDYLKGKTTVIKAKELISQKTRQYAKRQFTWARGHMKSWEMIYSPNINDLFNKTINKIF